MVPLCSAQQAANSTDRIVELKKAVEADPGNRTKIIELANLYYDTKDWTQAEDWYNEALKIDDEDTDVLTDLGTVQRYRGEPNESLATLDRAIAVDPLHWQAHYNKCVVLIYDLKRPSEAAESLKVLESMKSEHPDIPDLTNLQDAVSASLMSTAVEANPELEKAARELIRHQIPDDFLEEVYRQGAKQCDMAAENAIQPSIGRAITDTERSRLVIICYNIMKDALPYSVVEDMLYPIVAKHLTAADLKAVNAFLETPAGQKLSSLQAAFTREGQTAGEELGRRLSNEKWGKRMQQDLKTQFPQWFPDEAAQSAHDTDAATDESTVVPDGAAKPPQPQ